MKHFIILFFSLTIVNVAGFCAVIKFRNDAADKKTCSKVDIKLLFNKLERKANNHLRSHGLETSWTVYTGRRLRQSMKGDSEAISEHDEDHEGRELNENCDYHCPSNPYMCYSHFQCDKLGYSTQKNLRLSKRTLDQIADTIEQELIDLKTTLANKGKFGPRGGACAKAIRDGTVTVILKHNT